MRRFIGLLASFAFASLSGEQMGLQVMQGEASRVETGLLSSGKAIIQWDRFSIGPNERFHFEQTGNNPAVLNRVIGGQISEILGQLSSNGRVYLVNPSGVMIGPGGRVETAGFIASALDTLDADFIAEKSMLFSGGGKGSVVNLGTVFCDTGSVALIGTRVKNNGTIEAPHGKIGLGVGTEVILSPESAPYIYIKTGVDGMIEEEGAALTQEGVLRALSIELKSNSNIYEKAIQCSGLVDALRIGEVAGEIYLLADEGWCDVDGRLLATNEEGKGGQISALGRFVSLGETAAVDASGAFGGGAVYIGGGYQGKTPQLLNATCTTILVGAAIHADATVKGDGGQAICWSNEVTRMKGLMTARGGSASGDGGLIEVSGALLDFQGLSDTSAPHGEFGTLLLDPTDITITSAVANGFFTNLGGNVFWISTGSTSNILNTALETQLASNSVIINTSNTLAIPPATLSANGGQITVSSTITWSANTSLTLEADTQLTVSAAITTSGTGNITLRSLGNFDSGSGGVITGLIGGVGVSANVSLTSGTFRASGIANPASNTGGFSITGSAIVSTTTGPIIIEDCTSGGRVGGGTRAASLDGGNISSVSGNITIQNCEGKNSLAGNGWGFFIGGGGATIRTGGILRFRNITGGSPNTSSSNDHGIFLANIAATIFEGSAIFFEDIYGAAAPGSMGIYCTSTGPLTIGGAQTKTISITAGSLGTGSAASLTNIGISFNSFTTLQVIDGGTITLNGYGGGAYNVTDSVNHGINLNGCKIIAGTPTQTGLNTINITGVGGSGTGGTHYGVNNETTAATFQLQGTNPSNSLNFVNCVGGTGGATNPGINNSVSLSLVNGTLNFENISGGSGTGTNNGINNTSTISAPAIVAKDIFGSSIGFNNTGTLGDANVTNRISIVAASVGTGSSEIGIQNSGTIQVNNGGYIELIGTGGGTYNGSGSGNYGVNLIGGTIKAGTPTGTSQNTINITGIGGTGTGGSHLGVSVTTAATNWQLQGTNPSNSLNFINCVGGSGGGSNSGVSISGVNLILVAGTLNFRNVTGGASTSTSPIGVIASSTTIAAPAILMRDVLGGPTTAAASIGLTLSGAAIGSETITKLIDIETGSLGSTFTRGISNASSTFIVGDGGTMTLKGTGGGSYNGTGSLNHGMVMGGVLSAGTNGGSGLNTINLIGIGGSGSGGTNYGIEMGDPLQFQLKGSNPNNSVNIMNCVGGNGGGSNFGVHLNNTISVVNGTLNFKNISGGSGAGGGHAGIRADSPTLLTAPAIVADDIIGSSIGFDNTGTLGNPNVTNRISIVAASIGTGSSEIGIQNSGTIQVNNGGYIELIGTGGGTYNGSGSSNFGVNLIGGTIKAGTPTGTSQNTINITGLGGSGTGGSHLGVSVTMAATNWQLQGTNPGNSLNFINCVGGSGGGANNGMQISVAISLASGTLNFRDISGGSVNSGATTGIGITAGVVAPAIIARGILSGLGTANCMGFQVDTPGFLGSAALTKIISVSAQSVDSNNLSVGFRTFGGSLFVGDGGTISITGTGGGAYNSTANTCHGIELIGGIISAGTPGGTQLNTINFTGIGGSGSGGSNHGINVATASTWQLQGTNPANSINFINCVGGSGGVPNVGINFLVPLSIVSGTLNFRNIMGGSGGSGTTNHYGIINGSTISAPSIIMTDIYGGPGTGGDYGLLNTGTIGGSSTNMLSISAASVGSGSNQYGIYNNAGTIQVADGGSLTLNGTGGGAYTNIGTGTSSIGIYNQGTITAGTALGTKTNTITMTGVGGYSLESNIGLFVHSSGVIQTLGTNPSSAINLIHCVGGTSATVGNGANAGIQIQGRITGSLLNILNAMGGQGGNTGVTGNGNNGLYLNGGTIGCSTVLINDCVSGAGNFSEQA